MSQPCATPKCERISRGLCDCCKQNLCLQHLNEHNTLLISQLNPLIDEINALGNRLKAFNSHDVVSDGRRKLERWRKDCHDKIDRFFEEKCQELDRIVVEKLDREQKEIIHIQSKITKLIRNQEATREDIDTMASTIDQLEKRMDKIEKTNIQISTHRITIYDSLVQVSETDEHELDLSTLSPAYRTLNSPGGSHVALASNDQFLLVHQKPNLCLVDKDLNIVKQVPWTHKNIHDICWSSALNQFVVVEEGIFLVDQSTMSIELIQTIGKRRWVSGTCSDTSLILSTNKWGSSIVEFSLSPSVAIVKEWKSPITCAKDEVIDDIVFKSKMYALLIKNQTEKSLRIELRSLETLDHIWILPLNIVVDWDSAFCLCSLNCNEWLVADHETKHLLHITKDGKLKATIPYDDMPYYTLLIASDILAVSTEKGINLHKV